MITEKELKIPKDIDKIGCYLEEKFNLAPTQHAILIDELIKLKINERKQALEDVKKLIENNIEELDLECYNYADIKDILDELKQQINKLEKI